MKFQSKILKLKKIELLERRMMIMMICQFIKLSQAIN